MKTVTFYTPSGPVIFTEGIGGVSSISVKTYWGNLCVVRIYYVSGATDTFYSVVCSVTEPATPGLNFSQVFAAFIDYTYLEIDSFVRKLLVPAPGPGFEILPHNMYRSWSDVTGATFDGDTMHLCLGVTPVAKGTAVSILPYMTGSRFNFLSTPIPSLHAFNAIGTTEVSKDNLGLYIEPNHYIVDGSGNFRFTLFYSIVSTSTT
jgi:hypothetical protein